MRTAQWTLSLLLVLTVQAGAQVEPDEEPFQGPVELAVDMFVGEDGPQLTIFPSELTIGPNTRVVFHVENVGGSDHDLSLIGTGFESAADDVRAAGDGSGDLVKTPLLAPGDEYDLVVYFPSDFEGSVTYICSVAGHRQAGMEGTLLVGAAEAAPRIEDFGVNYLAYWIGLISFIVVFVVLVGVFFLFRYGESREVTDHRTGAAKAMTAAAAQADVARAAAQPAPVGEVEHRLLLDPLRFARGLIILAIVLLIVWQYTPLFGNA